MPITPPQGCKLRALLRTQSSSKTCMSCSKVKSQSSFSTRTDKNPHVAKIELSTDQKERNVASVGKPERMYPFSNYPPSHYRQSKAHPRKLPNMKSREHARSGSAPTASTGNQDLEGSVRKAKLDMHSAVSQPTPGASTPELQTPATDDIHEGKGVNVNGNDVRVLSPHEDEQINGIDEESWDMFKDYQNNGPVTESGLDDSSVDDTQGDYESTLDSLTFHEVGAENNLKSLSNLGSISPLELFHLLRMSDDDDHGHCKTSMKFKRSASVIGAARQSSRMTLSRQMSLNAIPEGEMVTQYSEWNEPSQVFDEEFLCSIMPFAFSASSKDEEQNSFEGTSPSSPVEVPDVENSRDSSDVGQGSDLEMTSSQMLADSQNTALTPTTLKVISVTWDWDKPGVHQKVTEQTLSMRAGSSSASTRSQSPVSSPLRTSKKTRPSSLLLSNSQKNQPIGSDIIKSVQVSSCLSGRFEACTLHFQLEESASLFGECHSRPFVLRQPLRAPQL